MTPPVCPLPTNLLLTPMRSLNHGNAASLVVMHGSRVSFSNRREDCTDHGRSPVREPRRYMCKVVANCRRQRRVAGQIESVAGPLVARRSLHNARQGADHGSSKNYCRRKQTTAWVQTRQRISAISDSAEYSLARFFRIRIVDRKTRDRPSKAFSMGAFGRGRLKVTSIAASYLTATAMQRRYAQ